MSLYEWKCPTAQALLEDVLQPRWNTSMLQTSYPNLVDSHDEFMAII